MKQLLLLGFIAFTFSLNAQENMTLKTKKVRELFSIMQQDSILIKTMESVATSQSNYYLKMFNDTMYTNHGIDVSKKFENFMDEIMNDSKEMALKLLNNEIVDVYAENFSLEDIENFTQFYKSQSGQKLLQKTPAITKEIMDVMMTKYQPDLQKKIMQSAEEMKEELENEKEETLQETDTDIEATKQYIDNDKNTFFKVERQALFPGGEAAWRNFIKNNLNHITPIKNGAPEGKYTVMVKFIVEKTGELSEIKTTTNNGFGMEEEAINLIKKSPNWIPGNQNGIEVKSWVYRPITFVVPSEK